MKKEVLKKLNRYLQRKNCYASFYYNFKMAEQQPLWRVYHQNCETTNQYADIIMHGFKWSETKEGHEFWSNIYYNH